MNSKPFIYCYFYLINFIKVSYYNNFNLKKFENFNFVLTLHSILRFYSWLKRGWRGPQAFSFGPHFIFPPHPFHYSFPFAHLSLNTLVPMCPSFPFKSTPHTSKWLMANVVDITWPGQSHTPFHIYKPYSFP